MLRVLAVHLLLAVSGCVALNCFLCNNPSGECSTGSCDGAWCHQQTVRSPSDGRYVVSKSCAPINTLKSGKEGCEKTSSDGTDDIICFCSSDFCNSPEILKQFPEFSDPNSRPSSVAGPNAAGGPNGGFGGFSDQEPNQEGQNPFQLGGGAAGPQLPGGQRGGPPPPPPGSVGPGGDQGQFPGGNNQGGFTNNGLPTQTGAGGGQRFPFGNGQGNGNGFGNGAAIPPPSPGQRQQLPVGFGPPPGPEVPQRNGSGTNLNGLSDKGNGKGGEDEEEDLSDGESETDEISRDAIGNQFNQTISQPNPSGGNPLLQQQPGFARPPFGGSNQPPFQPSFGGGNGGSAGLVQQGQEKQQISCYCDEISCSTSRDRRGCTGDVCATTVLSENTTATTPDGRSADVPVVFYTCVSKDEVSIPNIMDVLAKSPNGRACSKGNMSAPNTPQIKGEVCYCNSDNCNNPQGNSPQGNANNVTKPVIPSSDGPSGAAPGTTRPQPEPRPEPSPEPRPEPGGPDGKLTDSNRTSNKTSAASSPTKDSSLQAVKHSNGAETYTRSASMLTFVLSACVIFC